VPVRSSRRTKATILDLGDVPAGVVVTIGYVLAIDDAPQPACVAEILVVVARHRTDASAVTWLVGGTDSHAEWVARLQDHEGAG
jgi:hypothetical protein